MICDIDNNRLRSILEGTILSDDTVRMMTFLVNDSESCFRSMSKDCKLAIPGTILDMMFRAWALSAVENLSEREQLTACQKLLDLMVVAWMSVGGDNLVYGRRCIQAYKAMMELYGSQVAREDT